MKEVVCQIGQLYDFIATKTQMSPLDEFTKIPFRVEIETEDGSWATCPDIIKKEAPIYEAKFRNGYAFKGADKHILHINKDKGVFLDELKVGTPVAFGANDYNETVVESIEKVADKDFVYSLAVDTPAHLYRDAAGFLHHNTYSVKQAMKNEFPKGGLARRGYTVQFDSGDVGRSPSAIVAYFYKHRENKVIVLDDCDGFILAKDQSVQNLLKAMLDLDNTEANPKYITVSASIRKLSGKLLAMGEKVIEINPNKLRENILSVSVNGKKVVEEEISDEEKKLFTKPLREAKKSKATYDDYFGLGLLNEVMSFEDDYPIGELSPEDLEEEATYEEATSDGNDDSYIPEKWRFTSRMIMISNLRKADVNEAVLTRTDSYELVLTREEFIARVGEILPNLLSDLETETSKFMIEYAKKAAYAYLCAAVELDAKGQSVNGVRVKITAPLQFRLIAELAGKWLQRADSYAMQHGIEPKDERTLNMINNAIKIPFFIRGVIPTLTA